MKKVNLLAGLTYIVLLGQLAYFRQQLSWMHIEYAKFRQTQGDRHPEDVYANCENGYCQLLIAQYDRYQYYKKRADGVASKLGSTALQTA